ncbi:hypothetical protein TRFO_12156 [Tritrichomonas foetus]|uniref:Uncharacterized protein n=1 Tax=Tritrichomonas foetus TaxID=1144522 RepID=A0A1J4J2K5_9EUKA|nr:hypothetical protein TRFO_12156 [Tritrichomonas foetus]|eukprot:OHS92969.1 hypothetical protein TRFO_12156 [Tritrichomonas foetus]
MFVTPSPQMLMHYKSSYYGNQLLTVEFISQNDDRIDFPRNFSQLILDINFAYSVNRKLFVNKTRVYTTSLLSQFKLYDSPYKSIYLALLANKFDLQYSAIHCFTEAAKTGSTDAMNIIGRIYEEQQIKTDLALKWFSRAHRLNSIDSLQNLGNHFLNSGDNVKALYFLQKHFAETNSILTAVQIATILKNMNNKALSMKWLKFCAAHGIQSAVGEIVMISGVDPSAYQAFFLWLSTATRFNVQLGNNSQFHFSLYLRANFSNDYSIPPINTIQQQVQLPEPFVQTSTTKNIIQHKEPVQYHSIWNQQQKHSQISFNSLFSMNSNEKNSSKQTTKPITKQTNNSTSNLTNTLTDNFTNVGNNKQNNSKMNNKQGQKSYQQNIYLFPSDSKSQLLLSVFECCSPDINKRNLIYAAFLLKKLQFQTNFGIFQSGIWLSKCKSRNSDDLLKCGFICCLLNDYASAYELFLKSSNLGNDDATLMCGIILYHGLINGERNIGRGLFFLSRNVTDPVSLIYIGTASNEMHWLKNAAVLWKMEVKSGEIYEKVGDMFFQGIKLPKKLDIAKLWYGVAMAKYEKYGFETNDIIKKISDAAFDENSIA